MKTEDDSPLIDSYTAQDALLAASTPPKCKSIMDAFPKPPEDIAELNEQTAPQLDERYSAIRGNLSFKTILHETQLILLPYTKAFKDAIEAMDEKINETLCVIELARTNHRYHDYVRAFSHLLLAKLNTSEAKEKYDRQKMAASQKQNGAANLIREKLIHLETLLESTHYGHTTSHLQFIKTSLLFAFQRTAQDFLSACWEEGHKKFFSEKKSFLLAEIKTFNELFKEIACIDDMFQIHLAPKMQEATQTLGFFQQAILSLQSACETSLIPWGMLGYWMSKTVLLDSLMKQLELLDEHIQSTLNIALTKSPTPFHFSDACFSLEEEVMRWTAIATDDIQKINPVTSLAARPLSNEQIIEEVLASAFHHRMQELETAKQTLERYQTALQKQASLTLLPAKLQQTLDDFASQKKWLDEAIPYLKRKATAFGERYQHQTIAADIEKKIAQMVAKQQTLDAALHQARLLFEENYSTIAPALQHFQDNLSVHEEAFHVFETHLDEVARAYAAASLQLTKITTLHDSLMALEKALALPDQVREITATAIIASNLPCHLTDLYTAAETTKAYHLKKKETLDQAMRQISLLTIETDVKALEKIFNQKKRGCLQKLAYKQSLIQTHLERSLETIAERLVSPPKKLGYGARFMQLTKTHPFITSACLLFMSVALLAIALSFTFGAVPLLLAGITSGVAVATGLTLLKATAVMSAISAPLVAGASSATHQIQATLRSRKPYPPATQPSLAAHPRSTKKQTQNSHRFFSYRTEEKIPTAPPPSPAFPARAHPTTVIPANKG